MDENRDLFWSLVEPEYRRMRGFCHRLTGDRNDGDDLCQDALVRALAGFGSLRDRAAFRAWLYRIIINTFQTSARRRWLLRWLPLTSQLEDSVAGSDPEAGHAARRRLRAVMAALPPKDRALVTLYELEGWSLAELADMSGLTVGSLKTRLSRCRNRMRKALLRSLNGSGQNGSAMKQMVNGKDEVCVATKSVKD